MTAAVDAGTALYVYGVVAATETPLPVEVVREGGIAALVGRIAQDELDEERLRARLEDPAWVAERASAHDAVLEEALRAVGGVLPFRFLTVYRDEAQLRAFVSANDAQLTAALARVRGKVEIGIKGYADRSRLEALAAESPAVAALDAELADAQPGRSYLLGRRRDEALAEETRRLTATMVSDAHERLLAAAADGVVNPVRSREATGRAEEMVLNAAYLVDPADARFPQALEALRERHGRRGIEYERTGPWPPYNFVPRELGEP